MQRFSLDAAEARHIERANWRVDPEDIVACVLQALRQHESRSRNLSLQTQISWIDR